jgi:hypothetical protein
MDALLSQRTHCGVVPAAHGGSDLGLKVPLDGLGLVLEVLDEANLT